MAEFQSFLRTVIAEQEKGELVQSVVIVDVIFIFKLAKTKSQTSIYAFFTGLLLMHYT